jgi:hypothetical protein
MSVKQILFEESDASYRLKNHKSDKGKPVMRRQTWMQGSNGQTLRRHEYRLFSRATILRPEPDGSLSRNEGAALQPFPVIVHYFTKTGAGAKTGDARPVRTRKKRERFDEEEDDEDDELDEDDDDLDDAERGAVSQPPVTRRSRAQAAAAAAAATTTTLSTALSTTSGSTASAMAPHESDPYGAEASALGTESFIFGEDALEEWFGGNGNGAKRLRSSGTSWLDEVDVGVVSFDDRSVLRDSSFGLRNSLGDSMGAVMVAPDTTVSIAACCPDYAHRPVMVLALVPGFVAAPGTEYEYTCSFSDLEVPARLLADGVVSFTSPARQPGVVNFWISRRNATTRQVDYTKHRPFFFLPAPAGDQRLTLAWNHLRSFPMDWGERFGPYTKELDVSFNMLTNLDFAAGFPRLEMLVADNNLIAVTGFPYLPTVKHLSLNRNSIRDLDALAASLARSFPNLVFLSLLGNEICPIFSGDQAAYERYRHKISSVLPHLKILDSANVEKSGKKN